MRMVIPVLTIGLYGVTIESVTVLSVYLIGTYLLKTIEVTLTTVTIATVFLLRTAPFSLYPPVVSTDAITQRRPGKS